MLVRKLSLALVLAGVCTPLHSACVHALDLRQLQSGISSFTLSNGMTFIVVERPQRPVVSCLLHVDAGSAQETPGRTGLAHLVEHLAFKGTETVGTLDFARERPALAAADRTLAAWDAELARGTRADPGRLRKLEAVFRRAEAEAERWVVRNEFSAAVEEAGGRDLNALTRSDSTAYWYSLPANKIELWFYLESDRLLHPVFRDFFKERKVVLEEVRLRAASGWLPRVVSQSLAAAFHAHPYGEPVLGRPEEIRRLTRADALAFFRRHYVPENLTAVFIGDADPAQIRSLAEAYFGRLPAGSDSKRPQTAGARSENGERRVLLRSSGPPVVAFGFHRPPAVDPDSPVYELLYYLLASGPESRLQHNWIRTRGVLASAGGFSCLPGDKYPNLFMVYALPAVGHTPDEAQSVLEQELARLRTEPASADELEQAKRRFRADRRRQWEDDFQLARQLASAQALCGDWRSLFDRCERLNAVTAGDVQRVAQTALTAANRTAARIEPGAATDAKKAVPDAACAEPPGIPIPPRYQDLQFPPLRLPEWPEPFRAELPNGLVVLLLPAPSRSEIRMSAMIRAGARWAPPGKAGVAQVTGIALCTGGTTGRNPEELNRDLRRIGAVLRTRIDEDAGWATLTVPDETAVRAGLELLADVLTHPAFASDRVKAAIRQVRDDLARDAENPQVLAQRELRRALFASGASFVPTPGDRTLASIRREDATAFHRRFFQPENVILGVSGDFDRDAMLLRIREAFSAWPRGGRPRPSLPAALPDSRAAGSVRLISRPGSANTWVLFGRACGRRGDPEDCALALAARILGGGFSCRLFNRTRSQEGLAYSVYSSWNPGWNTPGCFFAAGGARPENTRRLAEALRREVRALTVDEVTDSELQRAKLFFSDDAAFEYGCPDQVLECALRNEYYGRPADARRRFRSRLERVGRGDVLRAARMYLRPEAFTLVVVGPPSAIAALKDFGG